MKLPSIERRTAVLLLAITVLAGMGLRAYGLSERSIWFDEASSWRTIQFPWREMFARVARNNHVPLHYCLLKMWTAAFGDSPWAMRGLSIVLAGATIVGVYFFACEAFRTPRSEEDESHFEPARWIGLFSAALVAISVPQIRAGWEARMYTLGTALVAFSSWTLFRALHARTPSWRPWAIHAIVTLLFAYTHHYALFSIAGQVIFLAVYFLGSVDWRPAALVKSHVFRGALLSYLVVAMGWGLWLPILVRQAQQVEKEWGIHPLRGQDVLIRCFDMFFESAVTGEQTFFAAICAGLCLALWLGLTRKGKPADWYVATLAVVPFAAGATVSFLGTNVFAARYLVFAQMFLLIGIAALVARLGEKRRRNDVAWCLLAAGAAIDVGTWYLHDSPHRPGMRAAAEYIESNRRPDEPVIAATAGQYFTAMYYFRDRLPCRLYSDGNPIRHYQGGPLVVDSDLILDKQIGEITAGRVWVICRSTEPVAIPIPSHWHLEYELIILETIRRSRSFRVQLYEVSARESQPQTRESATPNHAGQ